jgi:hypothetical protein
MRWRRNLKNLRTDRPPFRPLTSAEVHGIARAGGINLEGRPELAQEFEKSLDIERRAYEEELLQKGYSLTDAQIADRLREARKLARQLRSVLDDPALFVQSIMLAEAKDKAWTFLDRYPTKDLESVDRIIDWSGVCLKNLAKRRAESPDEYAVPPASRLGLRGLVNGLVTIWCGATGTGGPLAKRGSPALSFLREGHRIITQRDVTIDAALKWVRLAEIDPAILSYFKQGR